MSKEAAQIRADEIAAKGFDNMFVTISLGGEYVNSYDVEGGVTSGQTTTKEMTKAIQKKLNELGANPKLEEDGVLGRRTLSAILSRLNKNGKTPAISRAK